MVLPLRTSDKILSLDNISDSIESNYCLALRIGNTMIYDSNGRCRMIRDDIRGKLHYRDAHRSLSKISSHANRIESISSVKI